MPTGRATYIPAVPSQFFTNTGAVAAGYKLFSYYAGTSSKIFTYTDSGFIAVNTNPIVLDSAGRATIFLDPQYTYKFILATPTSSDPPAGGDILWTRDAVIAAKDTGEGIDIYGTAGEAIGSTDAIALNTSDGKWYLTDPALAGRSIDAPRLGMSMSVAAMDETLIVRLSGIASATGGVYILGTTYYLSATPGELSSSAPSGAFHAVPFGYSPSNGTLIFPLQSTARVGTRLALKTIGYSSGQGNGATTTDTELTNYAVSIPAGILDQPGAMLVVEGVCTIDATAGAYALKMRLDTSGTLVTVFASSGGVANARVPFRMKIFRRTATTGSYNGLAHIGAAAAGAPTNYMANAGTSNSNWDVGQTLKVYAHYENTSGNPGAANLITLTDYTVYAIRSYQGANV